LAKLRKILRNS